jgi:hypothetical protein
MKLLFVFTASAFLAFGIGLEANAQTNENPFTGAPTQYRVDVVTTQASGAVLKIRLYVDGDKRRTEQDTHNGPLALILRGDINLMYTVMVSRKAYRVGPLDQDLLKSLTHYELPKEMLQSKQKIGTETVKGQLCDEYQFSTATGKTDTGAGTNKDVLGHIWISKSTHLPVASETKSAETEWQNLEIGPQDASLFAPPVGFQRID